MVILHLILLFIDHAALSATLNSKIGRHTSIFTAVLHTPLSMLSTTATATAMRDLVDT